MSRTAEYEVVVVGGGIAGSFAAATAAAEGAEVVQLERKPRERSGHIACGDAIKSPRDPKKYPGPIDMEAICADEDVLADGEIDQIEWWDRELDERTVLPYADHSNVIDRYEFGQHLLDQAGAQGADQHYDTVVQDVVQNGSVSGIEATRDGERVSYEAEVVVDTAGAQSILQDMIAFDDLSAVEEVTFEKPHYTHFGSAYREIIETEEPVDFANAIVGKPLEQLGYVWYFPRTPTTINAGLGFQMSEEPIPLADRLGRDMETEPALPDAQVAERFGTTNKLGSSIALRRPLDSMVAPGYLTAGGAAATTHPLSGKGIRGAAISGYSAGAHAATAVHAGDTSEASLWGHNHYLFAQHGEAAKLASRDAYNVAASSQSINVLRAVAAMLPQDEIKSMVGTESKIESVGDIISVAVGAAKNFVGHYRSGSFEHLGVSNRDLLDVFEGVWTARGYVDEYDTHYGAYPSTRAGFFRWRDDRDSLDETYYDDLDLDAADRKY
jgi:digeranylgeranylglycerophospholipid reductase